ncbi:MAG: tetratricopeptide repeat protein [Planctomycetota bacterium]
MAMLWAAGVLAVLCAGRVWADQQLPGQGPSEDADLDLVYRTGHIQQPAVKVTEDDWFLVTGEKGAWKPKYLSTTVDEVEYHDRSRRWLLGMERVQQKNWPKALIDFNDMFDPNNKRYATEHALIEKCKWIPEIGNYYYGLVLLKNGQAKEAADRFMASFQAKQNGRYSLPALLGAADAYLQAGDADNAIKVLGTFKTQIGVYQHAAETFQFPNEIIGAALAIRDYADNLQIQYKYINAKVLYVKAMNAPAGDAGQQSASDAESACTDFIRKAGEVASDVDRSMSQIDSKSNRPEYEKKLGEWKELDAEQTQVSNMLVDIRIQMKDFDQARQQCQKMIDDYEKSRDPRMISRLPAAYAGLGKVAFFQADSLKASDPIKAQEMYAKSRWYYQQVIVDYFDNTKYLEDALYFCGLANEYLAHVNLEKDAQLRAYDDFKRLAEMLNENDPRYKDVSAELEKTRPADMDTPAPAPAPAGGAAAPADGGAAPAGGAASPAVAPAPAPAAGGN